MNKKMLFKKVCSIYASELHFATMIFPFIYQEVEKDTTIITILEKDIEENIEKVLKNIGLNSQIKEKIREIDWSCTNIKKIRKNLKLLEEELKNKIKIDIIVLGKNIFIDKVNQVISLWIKNNINNLEKSEVEFNIINCFSLEENKNIEDIMNSHEYILKTNKIEEILGKEQLLKAN